MNAPVADPILDELGNILLDCMQMQRPLAAVIEHVLAAIQTRFAALGHDVQMAGRPQAGLQPWQELLATALLVDFSGPCTAIPAVAAACGMSATQFCRAFRHRFGRTPQEWRVDARLDHAKALMRETRLSLTQIALECGFAEQSHFNHTFIRRVGSTPGAWRRREGILT